MLFPIFVSVRYEPGRAGLIVARRRQRATQLVHMSGLLSLEAQSVLRYAACYIYEPETSGKLLAIETQPTPTDDTCCSDSASRSQRR